MQGDGPVLEAAKWRSLDASNNGILPCRVGQLRREADKPWTVTRYVLTEVLAQPFCFQSWSPATSCWQIVFYLYQKESKSRKEVTIRMQRKKSTSRKGVAIRTQRKKTLRRTCVWDWLKTFNSSTREDVVTSSHLKIPLTSTKWRSETSTSNVRQLQPVVSILNSGSSTMMSRKTLTSKQLPSSTTYSTIITLDVSRRRRRRRTACSTLKNWKTLTTFRTIWWRRIKTASNFLRLAT